METEVITSSILPVRRVRFREVKKVGPGCRARSIMSVQMIECVFHVPRSGVFVERSNAA